MALVDMFPYFLYDIPHIPPYSPIFPPCFYGLWGHLKNAPQLLNPLLLHLHVGFKGAEALLVALAEQGAARAQLRQPQLPTHQKGQLYAAPGAILMVVYLPPLKNMKVGMKNDEAMVFYRDSMGFQKDFFGIW